MIEPIDIAKLIPAQLAAYPEVVRATVPEIVNAMRTRIIQAAQQELLTGADAYVAGVQEARFYHPSGRFPLTGEVTVASIELVGWLANAIEHGHGQFDMKPGLLTGRNAREGENGPYNIVPFRHGTPGSSGRYFAPMGSQHARLGSMTAAAAEQMGKQIHGKAKKLKPSKSHAGGGVDWAKGPNSRLPAGMSPKLRPHHTTDIHANMVRMAKKYRKATQASYLTFRTVSEASEGKFIHPGFKPRNFFEEGRQEAERVAGYLFKQALAGAARGAR